MKEKIAVIIPALNEEESIGLALDAIPKGLAEWIVVVDGGSKDKTSEIARKKGAAVLEGRTLGYGDACLKGLKFIDPLNPQIIVFMDGDYSDFPQEMALLVGPLLKGEADFTVGSRLRGRRESGAMPFHALWGNKLVCFLINLLHGFKYTDLGPFRAIRYDRLKELKMMDRTYGWTVEMQVKAVIKKLKILEIPVSYRKRAGVSKISGTFSGSMRAGIKIILTILKLFFDKPGI
ncbi:MAG: glycosyltransferase family 2 protein [Nitrospinae bacterium]|nr:glycosyltransferase family 2 protein [Nitrospinota bacterium]